VTYQRERISANGAHANAHGTWTKTFDVGQNWGAMTVKASGQFSGRTAVGHFSVVRRCHVGHVCA
jgi:hypothetical protein